MPVSRVEPANIYRKQQIAQAFVMHGTHWSRCDLCNQIEPLDYHEIYQRALTLNNEAARQASFNKAICALLCRECHAGAEQEPIARVLLQRNIALYGEDAVRRAVETLQEAMFTHLPNLLD